MPTVQLAGAAGVNARQGLGTGIPYLKLSFTYFYLFSSPFRVESGSSHLSFGYVCSGKNRAIVDEMLWF